MASAERTYVDPSALRSSYVHDDRSVRFCAWRKRMRGALAMTRFGKVEIVNSIQLAVHRRMIDSSQALGAMADLESDLREGRLLLTDSLWRRTLDLAAELGERHTAALGTRTLDVLHVATALSLEMTHLVTYDVRQASMAKLAGLRVQAP